MVAARPQFVSARQETAQEADAASKPVAAVSVARPGAADDRDHSRAVAAQTVAVPRQGEKFSDDELHARFGVPKRGGGAYASTGKRSAWS